jgi:hypothetical protein
LTVDTSWPCAPGPPVCDRCGERYFDQQTVQLFEASRQKIERGDLEGLRVTGESSDTFRPK